LRDYNKKPLCPLQCVVVDSKRWGDRKPKPKQGTYVSIRVTGFISGITHNNDGNFEAFEVEVEKVTYLGRPLNTRPSWSDTPSRTCIYLLFLIYHSHRLVIAKVETPAKCKLKFSYDTPTPAFPQKKRRLENESSTSSLEPTKDLESDPPALEYVDSPVATK
jgi:hypothetical protein